MFRGQSLDRNICLKGFGGWENLTEDEIRDIIKYEGSMNVFLLFLG
jgi:hypothetical protein